MSENNDATSPPRKCSDITRKLYCVLTREVQTGVGVKGVTGLFSCLATFCSKSRGGGWGGCWSKMKNSCKNGLALAGDKEREVKESRSKQHKRKL